MPYSLTARTRNMTDAPDGTPETYWLVNLVRPNAVHVNPPSLLCSTSYPVTVPLPNTVGAVQSKYNMLFAAPAPPGELVVTFIPLTCDGTPHHAAYTIEAFGKLE
jgi:hypothetical protein